jgi:hypothetical protein
MADDHNFTEGQSKALSIAARLASSISCACAIYMAVKAYQSRERMYHRLILGISLHLISYSAWFMYGTAAVPSEYSDLIWGARGTIQTCSAQGFFLQVAMAIPFYYASLSVYSFQAVRYNFDIAKYQWIEKWIHLGVHFFPVGSAIYLLYLEAFNPTGHYQCWIASVPFGCGEGNDGMECERGPQNIEQIAWIFAALPTFLYLLVPVGVMVSLYLLVRKRQRSTANINDRSMDHYPWKSKLVAQQAALYLLGLFWTYIFGMINNGVQWIGDTTVFAISLISVINVNLMGVWILLIYRYFRVIIPRKSMRRTSSSGSSSAAGRNNNPIRARRTILRSTATSGNESGRAGEEDDAEKEDVHTIIGAEAASFNIFDGTNATGAFSQYIFDADSEDEAEDQQETTQWDEVQEHV